jgi:hypothetical protein
MTERVSLRRHVLAAEVLLGGERVVRHAAQGQVGRDVGSASCERPQMVKLEVVRFAATLTPGIDVTAASIVASKHVASLSCGDVPTPADVSTPAPARRRSVVT